MSDDEYFARIDRENKEKLRAQLESEAATKSLEERKQLHLHKCGKCGASMDTHTYRGVEVEVCPECGAVLLDKGELQTLAGADQSGILTGLRDLFAGGRKV